MPDKIRTYEYLKNADEVKSVSKKIRAELDAKEKAKREERRLKLIDSIVRGIENARDFGEYSTELSWNDYKFSEEELDLDKLRDLGFEAKFSVNMLNQNVIISWNLNE